MAALLRGNTTQGRAVLQRVLRGRITFTPLADGRAGYALSAPTRFDKLLTGVATPRPAFIRADDRTGLAGITPADTRDGDYGRLLERAYDRFNGKGVASPTGRNGEWKALEAGSRPHHAFSSAAVCRHLRVSL